MAGTCPFPGPPGSPISAKMRIPKDQAELLDRSDSWIGNLKAGNHSLGLVNLPADILTSLTNFHRKLRENRSNSQEVEDSGENCGDRGTWKPEEGVNEGATAAVATPEAVAAGSPAENEVEAAATLSNDTGNIHQQPESFLSSPASTNIPCREPLRTTVQPQPPTGSLDTEEELEVVVARGIRDTVAATDTEPSTRLPSSLSYTSSRAPPCGQGDRNWTWTGAADVDVEPKEDSEDELESMEKTSGVPGRRGRRMQPPAPFSSDPVSHEKTSYLGNRFATAKIPPEASHLSLLDSSQASLSSNNGLTSPAKEIPASPAGGIPASLSASHSPIMPSKGHLTSPGPSLVPFKRPNSQTLNAGFNDEPTSRDGSREPHERSNPRTPNPDLSDERVSRSRSLELHGWPNPQTPGANSNDELLSRDGSSRTRKRPNPQTPNADLEDGTSSKKPRTSHHSACRKVLVPATPSEKHPYPISAGSFLRSTPALKPFEMYLKSYPTYSGDLDGFIRACICLYYLQSEDAMRDLLYDDFIRAFVGEYTSYVSTFADPDDALPAHIWFNRLTGKAIYDNLVITRENLHLVFETYPEETRAIDPDRSPQRPSAVQTPTPTRPQSGSTEEAIAQPERATTPTPKGRPEQHVTGTQPRTSCAASKARESWDEALSNQHSETTRHGDGAVVTSSLVQAVIPATQPPESAVISQRSRLESIQDSQLQLHEKRPTNPQTPYFAVAESPLKRVATLRDQPRRSLPLHGHLLNETESGNYPAPDESPDERVVELSVSEIIATEVVPADIRGRSPDTIDLTTRTTAQLSQEAKTPCKPHDANNQHCRSSAEGGRPHTRGSDRGSADGATGRDPSLFRPSRPSPKPREESTNIQDIEIWDSRSFEGREARSPDLHSSAYSSLASPNPNGISDGPVGTSPALVESESARKAHTGANGKVMDTRPSRHSIATSKPRASSGNDTLKKASSGRVQKEAGRKSLGNKGGKKKLSREEKLRKRDEALAAHIRRVQAERAERAERERTATSPASRP